jgi:hypothetical protein
VRSFSVYSLAGWLISLVGSCVGYLVQLFGPFVPVPVVSRSEAWVCGHSLAGIVSSYPAGGIDACLLWGGGCCQVEVSASGWSLVQRSPTECGVSECDREASIMMRPWATGGCCDRGKKKIWLFVAYIGSDCRHYGSRPITYYSTSFIGPCYFVTLAMNGSIVTAINVLW